ncbi:EAL domain-containing protein [Arthrobacter sp.]|uniref:EAL domain-containing protein n=1 Tax=Arthrobacter sp. TaxID=1667 RepID=UPI002811A277|nr:EAL domain-containing protein [Arthrobacter sp.]
MVSTRVIDDFGAGHAGLGLLVEFQPDLIKIDMKLVRGIDSSPARQAVVTGVVGIADKLGITVLAEGIETEAEFLFLQAGGIRLFLGIGLPSPLSRNFRARTDRATRWHSRRPRPPHKTAGKPSSTAQHRNQDS